MPRNILSFTVILLTFFCTIQGQSLSFNADGSIGSGGGSVSASADGQSFLTIIKELATIPFGVPGFAINVIKAIIENLFTAFSMIGKIPLNVVTTAGSNAFNAITSIPSFGMSVAGNTVKFNANLVGNIVSTIESIVGEIVKLIAGMGFSVSSAGIQGITFGRDTVENAVASAISIISNIITTMSRLRDDGIDTFKIREIMQLPVIKQVTGAASSIFNRDDGLIIKQMHQLQEFIDNIVKDNKEGILPILDKIFTIVFTLINGLRSVWNSGSTAEMTISVGPWTIEIGPPKSNKWQISGIAGETIGNKGFDMSSSDSTSGGGGGSSQSNFGGSTTGSSDSDDGQSLSDLFGQLFGGSGGSKSGGSGNSSFGGMLGQLFGGSGSAGSGSSISGSLSFGGSGSGSSKSEGTGSLGSSGSSGGQSSESSGGSSDVGGIFGQLFGGSKGSSLNSGFGAGGAGDSPGGLSSGLSEGGAGSGNSFGGFGLGTEFSSDVQGSSSQSPGGLNSGGSISGMGSSSGGLSSEGSLSGGLGGSGEMNLEGLGDSDSSESSEE